MPSLPRSEEASRARGFSRYFATEAREPDLAELCLELLLFGVQSPVNIGMTLRVVEAYCCNVSIFDRYGVLDDREKLKIIEDFGCGSLPRRGFSRLTDEAKCRAIASVAGLP